jgi:hypothetical protein
VFNPVWYGRWRADLFGNDSLPQLDDDVAEMVGVTITVLGDLALIGQSILRRFTLTLDHGKQVILEL